MITRKGFEGVVANGFAGMEFSPEASRSLVVCPIEMFSPSSDLNPIEKNIDKIIDGLTKWEPKMRKKGVRKS